MHLDGCLYLIHADILQRRYAALMQPSEAATFFVAVNVQDKPRLAQAAPNASHVSVLADNMHFIAIPRWCLLCIVSCGCPLLVTNLKCQLGKLPIICWQRS